MISFHARVILTINPSISISQLVLSQGFLRLNRYTSQDPNEIPKNFIVISLIINRL